MHQPQTFVVNGDAIREERMQAGMTQGDLAEAAGISRRYVRSLEDGTRRHMRPPRYVALRQALKATDERLLAPPRPIPPERK
ncbi:helix-turn-helix transcriptional regulator [Streptomyces ipomoeae]|uniref:helix-turn-helix transcriptional regulator n=1 Tax=Streptomyces ipomoeae TaxID=103232 RepID=UPI0029B014F9|nr:helix-turn-helix transcriptional regulator [Streptomyces ipomoeae]MDX2696028.1 helix-turn-helix transcriptional regulator [Streptomyces ipomoeae]MDX2841441.1 helix-turn-helix transcriptional regulator [Streptomyces ipomoeae]